MIAPSEAQSILCPLARTFAVSSAQAGCRGPSCACWRWEKITTSHPRWKAAMQDEIARTGEKAPFPKAARAVADNQIALGLVPEVGYCGVGGLP